MNAILLVALITILIGIPFTAILGWGQAKSREYLRNAADAACKGEFATARQYTPVATRFNPSLKSCPMLVAFYDRILARTSIATEAVIQIRDLASQWPKSRFELIWANAAFKWLIFVLIALSILSRLVSLFP